MLRWSFLGCLLLVPSLAAGAEEILRDGVPHVLNPESSQEGIVDLELEFLWERGDDTDDVFFGVVPRIIPDEESGEIYVLDSQLHEIHVFDATGDWLRVIGREGEGPGEFRNAGDMFMAPDGQLGVIQIFPGKIVQLRRDGEPGETFDPGLTEGFQTFSRAQGAAGRIVIAGATYGRNEDGGTQTNYLRSFDAQGKPLALYHEWTTDLQFGGMTFREPEVSNFTRRWAAAPDGRVAVARDFDAYRIHVHAGDGTLIRVIERPDYAPVKRTDQERVRFQTFFTRITSWNRGSSFELSPYHAAIDQLQFRPDGSLWVMSGVNRWRAGEGEFALWDVYDEEGVWVRQVRMLGDGDPAEDGYFFAADRVYQVTDLFGASMSAMGGEDADFTGGEAEPVRLVAWKMETDIAGR